MHVAQLLDPLARRAHVEIIETPLPRSNLYPVVILSAVSVSRSEALTESKDPYPSQNPTRDGSPRSGFADQQMDVVGHDDVSHNHKAISLAHLLKRAEKQIPPLHPGQPGLAMVATAIDKVQVVDAVITRRGIRHKTSLLEGY
jgi:hypothetical protein